MVLWYRTMVARGTTRIRTIVLATLGNLCRILELPVFLVYREEGGDHVTLQDFINALTGLATTMVPAATIGIIVVAGAVVSGAAVLLRRILRAGR